MASVDNNDNSNSNNNEYNYELVAIPPIHTEHFEYYDPECRFDEVYLYVVVKESSKQQHEPTLQHPTSVNPNNLQQSACNNTTYRYKLTVIDRQFNDQTDDDDDIDNFMNKQTTMIQKYSIQYPTVVFIIPAGRESEYMFRSKNGLHAIAQSAQTIRLIAVSLGRSYTDDLLSSSSSPSSATVGTTINSEQQIQNELKYIVQMISQQGQFVYKQKASKLSKPATTTFTNHKTKKVTTNKHKTSKGSVSNRNSTPISFSNISIPFMTLNGIGDRNCIATGETNFSGKYLIEQVYNVGSNGLTLRRLYFLNNPFVIQSEVAVVVCKKTKVDEKLQGRIPIVVDKSHVAFHYHRMISAGIVAWFINSNTFEQTIQNKNSPIIGTDSLPEQQSVAITKRKGLLIGLGAGGLIHFLQYLLGNRIELIAVELDPTIVQIAQEYFGIEVSSSTITTTATQFNTSSALEQFKPQQQQEEEEDEVRRKVKSTLSNDDDNQQNNDTMTISCSANDTEIDVIVGNGLHVVCENNMSCTVSIDDDKVDDTVNGHAGTTNANDNSDESHSNNKSKNNYNNSMIITNNGSNQNEVDGKTINTMIPFPQSTFSFIVIDVDSKDNTIGMSCPPKEFVTISYLKTLSQLLIHPMMSSVVAPSNQNNDDNDNHNSNTSFDSGTSRGGILAINVSARDPTMLDIVCTNVKQVFTNVYVSKKTKANDDDEEQEHNNNDDEDDDDDLNVVVFATNCNSVAETSNGSTGTVSTATTTGCPLLSFNGHQQQINSETMVTTVTIDQLLASNGQVLQPTVEKDIVADLIDCFDSITMWPSVSPSLRPSAAVASAAVAETEPTTKNENTNKNHKKRSNNKKRSNKKKR